MNLKTALGIIPAMVGFGAGSVARGFQAGMAGNWQGSEVNRLRRRAPRNLESQDRSLNYGVREDLLSEARALAQTFPIARSIIRKYANHVVGSMRMKWNTGDPKIDKIYADAWQAWMPMADLCGRHHFRKLTKIAVESVVRDGRVFGQKDRRAGFLQVNAIEGDRVSSGGIYNADVPGMISGIKVDGNGRAQSIRVWDRTIYGTFENPSEIPAAEIVHVFDSDRFDAVTGLTGFHTVLNTARDYKETGEAERLTAKKNSKFTAFVKSIMGGASAPAINLLGNDDSTSGTQKTNVEEVNDLLTMYGFPGEGIEFPHAERPSQGWQWLMEMQVREIALGCDLPFGVAWNMAGLGGPAVRFEMAQANRVWMAFLEDILEPMWTRPFVGAWITLEMDRKRLPFHPLWYKFKTPRPASITIDVGRDSKAGIAENAAGLGTATNWFAEEDMEFEEQTDRMVYEARYRESARLGIPIEQVKEVPLEQIRIVTAQGNPAEPADPSEPADEPATPPARGKQLATK